MRIRAITKTSIAAFTLTFTLSGCFDSVDKEQLAILTGDKSFTQIKSAYAASVSNQLPDDTKIYAYWLDKYDDTDPQFDFANYKIKTQHDHDVMITKLKKIMKEAEKLSVRQLRHEIRSAGILSLNIKFLRVEYIPHLKKLIKEKTKR